MKAEEMNVIWTDPLNEPVPQKIKYLRDIEVVEPTIVKPD